MNETPRPVGNPRKTASVRKLGAVDIAALLAAVQATPEAVWDAENADKPNTTARAGTSGSTCCSR